MMIQACLNGARHKHENAAVPVTPSELASDAFEVKRAGASEIHFHPRSRDGCETVRPSDVAASIECIREVVPGMPIGVGTGVWMEPGGSERLKCIQRWKILPDYASVNLNEDDAEVNMMVLARIGVGIEAGIWTSRDAEKFIHLSSAPQCLRVLLEMTSDVPEEAEREYRRCISILRDAGVDIPILLHGEGGSAWPMVELAKKEMHDTRVGFEDGLHMADGTPARSNAQLVEYAQSLLVQ